MSRGAGGVGAVLLGLAALVVAAGPEHGDRPLLVRHAGNRPVTVDTTVLPGPALRAWWADAVDGATVDAGSVPRGRAVRLYPPDTGDGAARDWSLVVVDAAHGLRPPA